MTLSSIIFRYSVEQCRNAIHGNYPDDNFTCNMVTMIIFCYYNPNSIIIHYFSTLCAIRFGIVLANR